MMTDWEGNEIEDIKNVVVDDVLVKGDTDEAVRQIVTRLMGWESDSQFEIETGSRISDLVGKFFTVCHDKVFVEGN